eukprot:5866809-Ditylum_brightwellii.AAC.1
MDGDLCSKILSSVEDDTHVTHGTTVIAQAPVSVSFDTLAELLNCDSISGMISIAESVPVRYGVQSCYLHQRVQLKLPELQQLQGA